MRTKSTALINKQQSSKCLYSWFCSWYFNLPPLFSLTQYVRVQVIAHYLLNNLYFLVSKRALSFFLKSIKSQRRPSVEKKEFRGLAGLDLLAFFKAAAKTAVLKSPSKEESHHKKVLRHITALLLSTVPYPCPRPH